MAPLDVWRRGRLGALRRVAGLCLLPPSGQSKKYSTRDLLDVRQSYVDKSLAPAALPQYQRD